MSNESDSLWELPRVPVIAVFLQEAQRSLWACCGEDGYGSASSSGPMHAPEVSKAACLLLGCRSKGP